MTTPSIARERPTAAAGFVALPSCDSCGRKHWYPKNRCPYCGGSWHWTEVAGSGQVVTWTEVHHDFGAETAFELPATIVIAAMDTEPAVRMVTVAHTCLAASTLKVDLAVDIRMTELRADDPPVAMTHAQDCRS